MSADSGLLCMGSLFLGHFVYFSFTLMGGLSALQKGIGAMEQSLSRSATAIERRYREQAYKESQIAGWEWRCSTVADAYFLYPPGESKLVAGLYAGSSGWRARCDAGGDTTFCDADPQAAADAMCAAYRYPLTRVLYAVPVTK